MDETTRPAEARHAILIPTARRLLARRKAKAGLTVLVAAPALAMGLFGLLGYLISDWTGAPGEAVGLGLIVLMIGGGAHYLIDGLAARRHLQQMQAASDAHDAQAAIVGASLVVTGRGQLYRTALQAAERNALLVPELPAARVVVSDDAT